MDNAGNLGPRSASLPFELSEPEVLLANDGESDEGINSSDLFFGHNLLFKKKFQAGERSGLGNMAKIIWSSPKILKCSIPM